MVSTRRIVPPFTAAFFLAARWARSWFIVGAPSELPY
jgi:hypothetical protein